MSVQIDTPENVPLDADIAGFGTRCMAAVVDYLVIIMLMIAFGTLFARSIPRDFGGDSAVLIVFIILQFFLVTFYHLIFEFVWNGQTPGKRMFKMRVIQSNGLPVTVSGILIRNLVRPFDFLPVFYSVGLVALFFSKHTQRLGDLAAKTIVVREAQSVRLEQVRDDWLVQYMHISRISPVPAYVQIETLSQQDRRDVVDYLRRRGQLQQRAYVANLLANRLAQKMQIPDAHFGSQSAWITAETFLEHVARAFELAELP
ncbi:MAG: RDD family protein [Anaerolineae bacterium]